MARIIAALCGGMIIGILATLAAVRLGQTSDPPLGDIVRDIVDVPQMTQAVAEKHREEQYANLATIEQVLALPTEFARSEALYVLAGRSNSAGVQTLIFEANRIADNVERVGLLSILFFRLAEVDPQSALALARMDQFRTVKSFERVVWRAWARGDLDNALHAAKTQSSAVHRNFAAQSLYAAFGYMGNETTDRIAAELEIGPDRSSRSRHLYRLADRSPAEAIAYINGLGRGIEQQEYVSWLAYYVSMHDPTAALRYADLFKVASDGKRYRNIVNNTIAREDPQAAIERMLASGGDARMSGEYHAAVSALASADLDAAKQYFEQARSTNDRQILGAAIASELAKKDPVEALAWARKNDRGRIPLLEMSVLGEIAQTDPQLALTEALNTSKVQMRSMLVSNVVQYIAQTNPADAVAYLDQIQDPRQRLEASQQLASAWIRRDSNAAINWIFDQDKETVRQLIQQASYGLLNTDVDAAIRILPRLDAQNQVHMRQQIAQKLATDRSPGEAQAFIRQFQGQPGYDQLQASLISGVAQTDVLMAKQLADQLTNDTARDGAYVQIIAQRAQTDPVEAARWLNSVSEKRSRGAAAGQLAAYWYASDPAAATRWVSSLPVGSTRDDAIMRMASDWGDLTKEKEDLIASIGDRDKRGQAKTQQIFHVMRTNPTRAREMLDDEDISSQQRQQFEMMISQYGVRF